MNLDKIKFRAKAVTGEWVYGLPRHYNHGGMDKWTIHESSTNLEHDIIPETLGCYTGFKDKNGKEIYEYDIVKVMSLQPDTIGKECVCDVIFYRGCYHVVKRMDDEFMKHMQTLSSVDIEDDIEVIGNIHDNKETTDLSVLLPLLHLL